MINLLKNVFSKSPVKDERQPGNDAVIIDVRTPFEFNSGHYPGSKNFPLDTVASRIEELKKLNKPLITVCRSGSRSATAKDILTRAGLDVCNGGAWTNLK